MALHTLFTVVWLTSLLLPIHIPRAYSIEVNVSQAKAPTLSDVNLLELLLNIEYLVAEFLLYGATGSGLDAVAPELTKGGPPPLGGKMANLDPFTKDVILQFALQKIGHLRAINRVVRGFPRPLLNISREIFADVVNQAFKQPVNPPFDPYANSLNFLIALYVITDIAPPGYVGISPKLQNATFKKIVAGLLGAESGQYAVIRAYLYARRNFLVPPYPVTVTEFANRISDLGNRLGKEGTTSEGLVVAQSEGAEGKISGNLLAGDNDSLAYAKEPAVILRIVYGTGNESIPGGFLPKGANGVIARSFLSGTT